MIKEQLAKDLSIDVHPWYVVGARGVMFKITLTSHGYTVAAKATTWLWITDLKHEGQIYQHLQHLQGKYIPVCLGDIDLKNPYPYTASCQLVHLLFLSYAGQKLCSGVSASVPRILHQAKKSIKAIHRGGVTHRDIALRNMLWNKELQRVLFIDFERSMAFVPKR